VLTGGHNLALFDWRMRVAAKATYT